MGKLHQVLAEKGRQGALALDLDRRVVDAAADYLGSEEIEVAYLFSGWAQACLPHKRLEDDKPWQVRTNRVSLVIQPGLRIMPEGDPVPVGVPYGSRARLILLYLQTQAVKQGRREIELGRSLHAWMRRMGIPSGGKSDAAVQDQADRLARCRMSFQIKEGGRTGLLNQHVIDAALFLPDDDDERPGQFLQHAMLSETFYDALRKHPVPVDEVAIQKLKNRSMSLDLYCWLAYRLHSIPVREPLRIGWTALKAQFGGGVSRTDHFRAQFKEALEMALAVYPDADMDVEDDGLVLRHSRPPVTPRLVAVTGGRSR